MQITPSFVEKIWGSTHLAPWFPDSPAKIGEVHFHAQPRQPILVKFVFTSEKLSVQVHPRGDSGKTEMWHILRAEPGAKIALGFSQPLSRDLLREASLSGEVEKLLHWFPVKPGETYFVPAGTVHAIGGGIALCEIQQNNDVTYRLYDYGRPRELHIEQALAVADLTEHPGATDLPVKCRYFVTEALDATQQRNAHQLIFLDGPNAGAVWLVPEGAKINVSGQVRALRTWLP